LDWTERLNFPVKIQGFIDGEWRTYFESENAIDFNFKLDSYKFNQLGVEKWRLLDSRNFLVVLVASIVRDFWVMERKEYAPKGYSSSAEKKSRRVGRGKKRKRVKQLEVTYLPRFSYNLNKYRDKQDKQIKRAVRVEISPHMVSGHVRQLPEGHEASDEARKNAEEFGFRLRKGETFVCPYEKGASEQFR